MARKKKETKEQRLDRRMKGHLASGRGGKRKASMFKQARKVAEIFKKLKAGGKLTVKDAKSLQKLRKYQATNAKRRWNALTPEQKKGIKKAKRSYTAADRAAAQKLAWRERRRKYGPSGRADGGAGGKYAGKGKGKGGSSKGGSGKKGGKKGGSSKGSKKGGFWDKLKGLIQK